MINEIILALCYYHLYVTVVLLGRSLHFLSFHVLQEYSEDSNSEPDVDLENQYYNSKALKEEDPRSALESFQKVSFCS